MAKSKIIYNPKHSVKKNAKDNGVSEDAIRNYIKVNGIDRSYERKVNIVNSIRDYLKKNPNATKEEVAKKTKHSTKTIRKYWEIAKGSNGKEKMVCTNCRHQQDLHNTFTYCPNCGALIDGRVIYNG